MSDQAIGFRLAASGDADVVNAFNRTAAAQDRVAQAAQRLGAAQGAQGRAAAGAATANEATARALGMLGPQLGDLFSQISAGGSATTAFIQQGLQMRDMFAQDAEALAGLKALITPTTVALGLFGGAVAAVALAYKQGSSEADAYLRAIVTTGNAAGTSVGQLDAYAAAIDQQIGTQHEAAKALAALVGTGRVGAEQLTGAATTALKMERELGVSVADTAKAYAELGKDPLAASLKLNEATNYLTESTYRRIKALEEQGRADEAGAIAQQAYSEAMSSRMDRLADSLGLVDKAWRGITGAAKDAWDAMRNVGRKVDPSDTAAMQRRMEMLQTQIKAAEENVNEGPNSSKAQQLRAQLASLNALALSAEQEQMAAQFAGEHARHTADVAAWESEVTKLGAAQLPAKERARRQEQEIAAIRREGLELGRAQWEIDARIAAVKEKYTDKGAASAATKEQAEQVKLAQQLAGLSATFGEDWDRLSKMRAKGALSTEQLTAAQAELLSQQPFMREAAKAEAEAAKLAGDAAAKAYQQQAQALTGLEADLRTQQQRNEAIGLEGIALAELVYQRDLAAIALREEAYQIEVMQGATPARLEALRKEIELRQQLATARRTGGTKDAAQSALDKLGLGSRDIEQKLDISSLRDAAAGLSSPLGQVVTQFQTMLDLQAKFGEQARLIAEAKQGDAAQQAKAMQAEAELAARVEQARLAGYASMAGAAKGFFSEGSKGYKALGAAEKVFRAIELANAVKNAATQLGLVTSVTAAKVAGDATAATSATVSAGTQVAAATAVGQANALASIANQGNGDPYSAWVRIPAMAAIMAALGFATGALGGGAPATDPGNTGTGTVFGDSQAQSKSVANALEQLGEVNTQTMRYSAQMAASLHAIENNIGGLTNLLIRAGAVDAAAAGIQTGAQVTGLGRMVGAVDNALINALTLDVAKWTGLNGIVSNMVGKLFNAKTSITGQGVYGAPQALGAILANGFDASYYADTFTRKKAFGVTYSRSNGTRYTAADAELERQFGLILGSFNDAVEAAAGPLGAALSEVEQRLTGFVVNIGKINLQGLSGSEIQEKLGAVFGAAGDDIAKAALPGLVQYQRVGEGYLETAIRVSSSTEAVRETLRSLGGTVLQLGADGTAAAQGLIGAFGDIDAFSSQTQAYYEAYYTDAERAANTTRQLSETLARLGITALPASRDAYRDLVDAQDLTTDSGRSTYAALIGLSNLFADLTDAIESAGASVRDEINRLRGVSDTNTVEGLAALQARFAITSAQARAGDATALESLPELSRAIEAAATATASSALEVARIRAGLATSLEGTLGITVPAFANGGDHAGGLAWVGEKGPELVNLPPSRVYTARESSQLMRASGASDDETKQLLRQVLAELQAQRDEGRIGTATLARHANRTATLLERVIPDGDALAVRAAEA